MHAITLWQPWASLVAIGAKPFEFRSWEAPRRHWGTRIAIHAGARLTKRAEVQEMILRLRADGMHGSQMRAAPALELLEAILPAPASLPHGAIVATAVLGRPVPPAEVAAWSNDSDRGAHFNWAWPLSEIRALDPVPVTGAMGFWSVPVGCLSLQRAGGSERHDA